MTTYPTLISGACPHCKAATKFKELSFADNVAGLSSFVYDSVKSPKKLFANLAAVANVVVDKREFPNYKCGACGKEVMQCQSCRCIIPYADDGSHHVCVAAGTESA